VLDELPEEVGEDEVIDHKLGLAFVDGPSNIFGQQNWILE